jgi:quercetin dioxygenase-like cupin family protein
MPVVTAPEGPTHSMHGAAFSPLVSPSRGATEASVWQVEIPPGTPAAPHELTREEIIVVLSGTAEVSLGGVRAVARPGDAVVVPPDTPFELHAVGDEPLRAIAYLPAGGQARLGGETFTPPWAE